MSTNGSEPQPEEVPDTEVSHTIDEPPVGPVIHVPDRELGTSEDGGTPAAPKKRTRRGSRGGKNRRKKTAATSGTATATAEAPATEAPEPEAAPAQPSQNGDEDWGYTPMSQWGLDESE